MKVLVIGMLCIVWVQKASAAPKWSTVAPFDDTTADDIGLTTDNYAMDKGFENDPGDLKNGYVNSDHGSEDFSTEKVDIPLSEGVGKRETKLMLTLGFMTSITFAAFFVVSYFLFLCRKCTRGRKPQSDHFAVETFPGMDPQADDYQSLEEVIVNTCQRYYETPVRMPDDLEEVDVHTCQRYWGMPVRMPDDLEEVVVHVPGTSPRQTIPNGSADDSTSLEEVVVHTCQRYFGMAVRMPDDLEEVVVHVPGTSPQQTIPNGLTDDSTSLEEVDVHTCQRYFGMPVRMPDDLQEVLSPATVPPKKRVRFCLPDGRIVSSHMEEDTPIETDNLVSSMAIGAGSQLEAGGPVIQQCGPLMEGSAGDIPRTSDNPMDQPLDSDGTGEDEFEKD